MPSDINNLEEYIARAEALSPGRAARLFSELDRCYWTFTASLPRPLSNIAIRRDVIRGMAEKADMDGLGELNPVLVGVPWLFWEQFSNLDDEPFLQVAEAGMFLVLASILQDHLIDQQITSPEMAMLLHQVLYATAEARYRVIFDHSEPFWTEYHRLSADHLLGLATELETIADPTLLTEESLRISADGKVSPIVTTIAAMAELSNRPSLLAPIEESLKHIAIASQLLDDVGDWQEDVNERHLTYFLRQLAPAEVWQDRTWPDPDHLQGRIDKSWADVNGLGQVKKWLELSISSVDGLACPGWVEYVQEYWDRADGHQTRFTARHMLKAIKPLLD